VHRTILLKAESGNQANILDWTAYQGRRVKEYQVFRGNEPLYTVPGDTTRLRDEQVICDSFYRYQIRAKLSEGYQTLSNTDSAEAFDTKPPKRVYLQRATVDRFNDVVALKWQEASDYDAKGYEIYRSQVSKQGISKVATVQNADQTTYYDSIALGDREICYEVRVIDHCDNTSPFSNRACIIQPEGEALDLKNKLSWPRYRSWESGLRNYEVYKRFDSAFYRQIGQTDTAKRLFTDKDLADSADQFCYYIKALGWQSQEYARSTRICIRQPAVVHIPNSFSPGITPGLNDQFGPEGLYIKDYTMKIYNRWGQQVFKTTEGKKWDGTYEGEIVPQGIYTYKIIAEGEDGKQKEFQGTLTVIR
jgi:gliding motility-associated-like protein